MQIKLLANVFLAPFASLVAGILRVYLSHNRTNRVIYTFAAIWTHTAKRKTEIGRRKERERERERERESEHDPLKIQTSDTSNK